MKKRKIITSVLYSETGDSSFDALLDDDIYEYLKGKHVRFRRDGGNKYLSFQDSDGRLKNLARFIAGITDRALYAKHKDGNVFNCTRENIYTESRSRMNAERNTNKRYKGVTIVNNYRGKKAYQVDVWVGNRYVKIGRYNDIEIAGRKYDAAADFFNNNKKRTIVCRNGKEYRNFPAEKNYLTEQEIMKIEERSNNV